VIFSNDLARDRDVSKFGQQKGLMSLYPKPFTYLSLTCFGI